MMNRCLLPLCACLLGILAFAQENPVLMRVNGREVSRSEFEYSYHHYRAGGGRDLSPKEYALLFSQAIQKVEAAKAIRLDTTAAFRKQQEENRIKLMEDCLVDKQTVDSCVRVSYQKMALKARTGQVQVMQDNNFPTFGRRKSSDGLYLSGYPESARIGFLCFGEMLFG